jgi:hypothetical protein
MLACKNDHAAVPAPARRLLAKPGTCRVISALGAASILLGFGCSNSDDKGAHLLLDSYGGSHSPLDSYGVPILGCEQYSYDGCDVTSADCQSNVFGLVKCIRQTDTGTLVPVVTITAEQYRALLVQSTSGVNADDLTRQENALVLLGLASPGDLTITNQIDVLVNTVAAYYSSDDKTITIITGSTSLTPSQRRSATATLGHEMVHMLQDQEHGLSQFHNDHSSTYDADLACLSVFEGEAQMYSEFLRVAFVGVAQTSVSYPDHFGNGATYVFGLYATDSPYLIVRRVFPYFYGGRYAYFQWKAAGQGGISALFASPPSASLPYIVSQTGVVDTPLSPMGDTEPSPVPGATLFAEDTLGAWLSYEYLSGLANSAPDPIQTAAGWRGDHLWTYKDETTGNIALIWRVKWSSAAEAANFAALTNAASASPVGIAVDARHATAADTIATVVAVSGSFDLASWQSAASDASPASSATSTTGSDAGTPIAAPIKARQLLLTPVPRPLTSVPRVPGGGI